MKIADLDIAGNVIVIGDHDLAQRIHRAHLKSSGSRRRLLATGTIANIASCPSYTADPAGTVISLNSPSDDDFVHADTIITCSSGGRATVRRWNDEHDSPLDVETNHEGIILCPTY